MKKEQRTINKEQLTGGKKQSLVFLICLFAFLICLSCPSPLGPPRQPSQEQQPVHSGKGSLSVHVAGDFSRTIMPDTTNAIKAYRLIFTNEDQADITVNRLKDELSHPVYLEAGTYSLKVIGCADTACTYPVAEGSPSPNQIIIAQGGATTCDVALTAYGVVSGKQGSFNWNISLPGGLTDAKMTIGPMLADGTAQQELDLMGAVSPNNKIGSVVLASSYYQITFTLKKAGYQDIIWYETLHVYQNMTSQFNHAFVDDDFDKIKYTVTFNYNHSHAPGAAKQTRAQGGTASEPLSVPARKGYVVEGWYTDAACTIANKWNFATQINNSQTLYARWKIDMISMGNETFTMGDTSGVYDDEKLTRTITLGKFYMGRYPVTQEQYEELMGYNPSGITSAAAGESDYLLPVENITWYDAVEFCNKLSQREGFYEVYLVENITRDVEDHIISANVTPNWTASGYRLPTEAEWEYACRAGTTTDFYATGDLGDIAWHKGNSIGTTHEVGQLDANSLSLYDMHGNVWEWCWDRYGDYGTDLNNPKGPAVGINRVSRGGGWIYEAEYLRSAYRGVSTPEDAHKVLGFRVVKGE